MPLQLCLNNFVISGLEWVGDSWWQFCSQESWKLSDLEMQVLRHQWPLYDAELHRHQEQDGESEEVVNQGHQQPREAMGGDKR